MKIIIASFFAVVLCAPAPARADTGGMSMEVGLKSGLSLATWKRTDGDSESSGLRYAASSGFGVFSVFGVHRIVSIQPEILYMPKGTKLESLGQWLATYRVKYLQVPVLGRVALPHVAMFDPYVLGGPVLGFTLDGTVQTTSEERELRSMASWELGLIFGLGATTDIAAGLAVSLEARYDLSLTSVYDESEPGNRKNRAFLLALGVSWTRNRDSDNDGIMNPVDQCPRRAEDNDGFEDADGCPDPDNDGDGIADTDDGCPAQPEDVDGFEDSDGCPDPDNDSDGVLDAADTCPDVSFTRTDDGCPPTYETIEITSTSIILKQPILFTRSKASLPEDSRRVVDELAQALTQHYPALRLRIEGHADGEGSMADNERLSQQRADVVRDYLISQGVAPERLVGKGYGELQPRHHEGTDEARQKNRRVELVILGAP